jgi:hypothetical protein
MNKNVGIALAVLLVLVVGAIVIFSSKKPKSPTLQTNQPVPTVVSTTTTKNSSLRELFAAGLAQKCTYTTSGTQSSTGTIYIGSGKMRGDFTVNAPEKQTVSHMIVDGTTSYIWMEGESKGFKMTFDPKAQPTGTPANSQSVNPDQKVDYSCSVWSPDSTLFAVPTSVQFSDFSSMVAPKAPADKCAACSYLTGDEKTQCLSALNCK